MILRALCGEKYSTMENTEVRREKNLNPSVILRALCGEKKFKPRVLWHFKFNTIYPYCIHLDKRKRGAHRPSPVSNP